jgi:DNA transformation protein
MPITQEFVHRVNQQMSRARPVRSKAMFGGLGFYFDDVFFAVADDDKLFFKVDDENLPSYEAYGMSAWDMGGQINNAYREVPPTVFEDEALLGDFIDAAVKAALSRKAKSKSRKAK